jgi:hypothetical protein
MGDMVEKPLEFGFAQNFCLLALADDIPPISLIKKLLESILSCNCPAVNV